MVFYLVVENKENVYKYRELTLYFLSFKMNLKNHDMLISEMREVYEKNRNAL